MWIKINKHTFKSYLNKLKKQNITEVKVFYRSKFDGMIDGEREINEEMFLKIEKIEEDIEYKETRIYYDIEDDVIRVSCFACFHYIITDERFNKLKEIAKAKFVVKQL
jgi:hypothetical protein